MQDLTTGSVTRHLLKTAGFMLVTMVFQTLYFLIDLYWVGRLGKEAVAAVAIAGNLTFIVLAISQMLGVGTTTLVSHAAGQKDRDRALLVFNQSQVLSVVVGGAFLVLAMALRRAYASTLGADGRTADMAADYLTWFIPAMALQFAMVAMGSALRGTGNFKPGMIVQTASVVINMILAPFLIFGWGTGVPLGVAGAALSSLVAVVVGTVWLAGYFFKASGYLHFQPATWTPRLPLWWQMLKIGLPAGAEFALMAVYLFIVYVITRPFGAAAQAGFGIGLRIIQAGFMPVVALGFSVAPVAGQNFGARLGDRVKRTFSAAAVMATARDGRVGARLLLRRGGDGQPVHSRSGGGRGRRGVSPDRGLDLRRLGIDLRLVEHVPGDGQHASTARGVVLPHAPRRDSGHRDVADAGLRAAVGLVPVGVHDRFPGRRRALAAAARVPRAPFAGRARAGVRDARYTLTHFSTG